MTPQSPSTDKGMSSESAAARINQMRNWGLEWKALAEDAMHLLRTLESQQRTSVGTRDTYQPWQDLAELDARQTRLVMDAGDRASAAPIKGRMIL